MDNGQDKPGGSTSKEGKLKRYWRYWAVIAALAAVGFVFPDTWLGLPCFLGMIVTLIVLWNRVQLDKEAEAAARAESRRRASAENTARSVVRTGPDPDAWKKEPGFTLFRIHYAEHAMERSGAFSVSSCTVCISQKTGVPYIEYSDTAFVDPRNLLRNSGRQVKKERISFERVQELIDTSEDKRAERYRGMNEHNWLKHIRSKEPFPKPDLPIVYFGRYPQGKKLIARISLPWYVLEKQEDRYLLLTRDVIDGLLFDRKSGRDLSYSESLVRRWLNKSFLNLAFEDSEKEAILQTDIRTDKFLYTPRADQQRISEYARETGQAAVMVTDELYEKLHLTRKQMTARDLSQDKVFLLSGDELRRYIPAEQQMAARPTEHALQSGVTGLTVYSPDNDIFRLAGAARWWLRDVTTSDEHPDRCYVETGSWFGGIGSTAPDTTGIGVRPALWVRREAVDPSAAGKDS